MTCLVKLILLQSKCKECIHCHHNQCKLVEAAIYNHRLFLSHNLNKDSTEHQKSQQILTLMEDHYHKVKIKEKYFINKLFNRFHKFKGHSKIFINNMYQLHNRLFKVVLLIGLKLIIIQLENLVIFKLLALPLGSINK